VRKNAGNVIAAFLRGESCNEKTISTDGVILRSYAMPIARRVKHESGLVSYEVIDRDASPSHTTSSHISAVRQHVPGPAIVKKL